jgi:RNA polymerase sigma-70 factor (ECF subfamily)
MSFQESSKQSDAGDMELVAQARKGDREAFSELVRRYYERVYGTIYSLVGDRDDADDLAQEAFLKAYRSLSNFRGQSQFYTWVYRIGVNCCLDWMKSRNRRKDVSLEREPWGLDGVFRHPQASDAGVLRKELQAILEQAMETLPVEYRATLVLREIDGLAYDEIAYALGCSVGTVKSRLFRSRAQLREVLEKDYREWYGT